MCLLFLKGNFVSTKYNLSSGYIPSFQKKEVGTVGQRIQLAPLAGQHSSKNFTGYLFSDSKNLPHLFDFKLASLPVTLFSFSSLFLCTSLSKVIQTFPLISLLQSIFLLILLLIIKKKRPNLQNSSPFPTLH